MNAHIKVVTDSDLKEPKAKKATVAQKPKKEKTVKEPKIALKKLKVPPIALSHVECLDSDEISDLNNMDQVEAMSGCTTRSDLRILVRGLYAIQKVRIQLGNRIVSNWKVKMGQEPSESEEVMGEKEVKLLTEIRRDFRLVTDGILAVPSPAKFKAVGVISNYTEMCMISEYEALYASETSHKKHLGNVLLSYDLFNNYLTHILGIGPMISGSIISEIDIHKAEYPSSIQSYCGLDVASDGKRTLKKE